MLDFIEDTVFVVYQFWHEVDAKTTKQGLSKMKPLINECEAFAESMSVWFRGDHIGAFDGTFSCRLQFYIKAPQYVVLTKVAALFAFAASHKLLFGNQFFPSEEK